MPESRTDLEQKLARLQKQYNDERKLAERASTKPGRRELAYDRLKRLRPQIEAAERELDRRWS